MKKTKRFLTRKQLAEKTSKTVVTIDRWVARGWITAIKIGRSTLFDEEQVDKEIKAFEVGSKVVDKPQEERAEAA